MSNKIKPIVTNSFVNGATTVATAEACLTIPAEKRYEELETALDQWLAAAYTSSYCSGYEEKGVAVCCAEDEYDSEYGEALASARASKAALLKNKEAQLGLLKTLAELTEFAIEAIQGIDIAVNELNNKFKLNRASRAG